MAPIGIGRTNKMGSARDGKEKERDHFHILKRIRDYPGNENVFMFLFKHCLIAAKDFFLNIDNTIEGRISKGVSKLSNLCYSIISRCINTEISMYGRMPVNIIKGGQ